MPGAVLVALVDAMQRQSRVLTFNVWWHQRAPNPKRPSQAPHAKVSASIFVTRVWPNCRGLRSSLPAFSHACKERRG